MTDPRTQVMSIKDILILFFRSHNFNTSLVPSLEEQLLRNMERHLMDYQQIRINQQEIINKLEYDLENRTNSIANASRTIQELQEKIDTLNQYIKNMNNSTPVKTLGDE